MQFKLTSLEAVKSTLIANQPIMFDTETVGLYGTIRLAQFYQRGWDTPLLVEKPNPFELVALLNNQHFVCHNAHYDITVVQEQCGKHAWVPTKFDDTFLLARLHFYLKEGFALDDVVKYVLGFNPYENNDQQKSDWSTPVLSQEQLEYAAADVVYLADVWDAVKEQVEDYSYKLDMLCLRYCLDFQNNGFPVDIEKLDARFVKNSARLKEINLPINANSWQQVRPYINASSSDDEALARLSLQGNERAIQVRETRKLIKNNSFLTKFKNTMDITEDGFGVIYGKFKCSARSGRTTSDDQNLQQLPRSLKGIFGVPEGGRLVLIHSDFAQAQLRAVCAQTGDRTMEKLFREGEDLHSYVAKIIFGENFTKEHRQICKTANFGLLFGAGVQVFTKILIVQAGVWLSEAEANAVRKKWIALWKEIAKWQEQGMKDWKKKRPWSTPLGRQYTAKMMTDQLAMQIQGFEAEVAKLAMHYMLPKLKALHTDIKLCNFIHDSYIFTCPNEPEIYKEASRIIACAMQEGWSEMCKGVTITDLPMPVTVKVGWNWGDIEGDKVPPLFEHSQ